MKAALIKPLNISDDCVARLIACSDYLKFWLGLLACVLQKASSPLIPLFFTVHTVSSVFFTVHTVSFVFFTIHTVSSVFLTVLTVSFFPKYFVDSQR